MQPENLFHCPRSSVLVVAEGSKELWVGGQAKLETSRCLVPQTKTRTHADMEGTPRPKLAGKLIPMRQILSRDT